MSPAISHETKPPPAPWIVEGAVAEVIDGDTVRVDLDLGAHAAHRSAPLDLGWHIRIDAHGHVRLRTDVRLEGLNAPEKATDAGKTAKAALAELLPVDTRVEVVSRRLLGSTEKYGRVLGLLRKLNRPMGPLVDVNGWLIESGYAKAWDGKGERPV